MIVQDILGRSVYSFFAIGIRSVATLLTTLLLARGLGAENYGQFAFLVTSLTVISSLLDFGTTSAFFSIYAMEAFTIYINHNNIIFCIAR